MNGVSAIIVARNEESRIGACVDSARNAGFDEVILVDGGSSDPTREIAAARGARVIDSEPPRARQLNAGAAAAKCDALVFVHGDTLLPPGAAQAIAEAAGEGFVFGGFRLSFLEPGLGAIAALINFRTRLTREPWGDQAQFVTREAFIRAGGFREIPLMEDYDLARRMKRIGRTRLLPLAVRTSGRRFRERGIIRTTAMNWTIVAAWHLGVSPERLARWYRGSTRPR